MVRLNNIEAAKDCTQNVFFTLYRKKDSIHISENIKLWLYRTADNCIKNYRKTNIEHECYDECENIETESFNDDSDIDLSGILETEELKMLNRYYIDGFEVHDISKEFNISEAAVYKRIQRSKQKLKKYLVI